MLTAVHARLANAVILYMVVVGLWALGALLTRRGLSGSLVATLLIAEGLILVQGLFGVLLLLSGSRPANLLHLLYGVAAAISLPAALAYTRDRSERTRLLVFAFTALWIVGLAIRGIMTAM